MVTSPHMLLTIWNLTSDVWDTSVFAANLNKLDEHDHTFNKGKQVPTGGIEDEAITYEKLDPDLKTQLGI